MKLNDKAGIMLSARLVFATLALFGAGICEQPATADAWLCRDVTSLAAHRTCEAQCPCTVEGALQDDGRTRPKLVPNCKMDGDML